MKIDWTDPDNHEAHRRMAAERVGNYIGCAESCQTAWSMYPEILELRTQLAALKTDTLKHIEELTVECAALRDERVISLTTELQRYKDAVARAVELHKPMARACDCDYPMPNRSNHAPLCEECHDHHPCDTWSILATLKEE